MKLTHKTDGDALVVYLRGELDHHAAGQVRTQLDDLWARYKPRVLALDLRDLSFMDSSGVGVILGRYKKVRDGGGFMVVRNPGERVDRILMMSGVYRVMDRL